jgi:protein-S-isoprenylcysteine O-methyltransferase Ste14
MKHKTFIDSNKGFTPFFFLILLVYFKQWQNPTAFVYLALHGSYGVLWVLKSNIFPDRTWERQVGWGYGLISWLGLCLYWVGGWLIFSRGIQTPAWWLGLCLILYIFGIFFHFAADMQKFVSLKLNPKQLITDGLFARVRNMNYFGELLIYAGFGLLAMHWLPVVILLVWVAVVWLPNMARKDKSLARYPEFEAYSQRTKRFLPFIY